MGRGRPRLAVGEHGQVRYVLLPSGNHLARVEIRDRDGRLRQVAATGPSKGAATRSLQKKLDQRRPQAAASHGITAETTVADLTQRWLEHRRRNGNLRRRQPLSPQTIEAYDGEIRRLIIPALGGLRLGELNVGLLQQIWDDLDDTGISTAGARGTLKQALDLACQHDAISANPMTHVAAPPRARREIEILTLDQVRRLRHLVHPDTMRTPGGRGPTDTLATTIDLCLGTGARIGEIVALQWHQADLEHDPATVHIDATIIEPRGTIPYHRQSWTKSRAVRTLILPDHLTHLLQERRETTRHHGPQDPIVTNSGSHLWPGNLRTTLRRAIAPDPDLAGTTPHTLRRTVGTRIAWEHSLEAAASQLGHSLGTSVTAQHYIAHRTHGPDTRDLLAPFFTPDN